MCVRVCVGGGGGWLVRSGWRVRARVYLCVYVNVYVCVSLPRPLPAPRSISCHAFHPLTCP